MAPDVTLREHLEAIRDYNDHGKPWGHAFTYDHALGALEMLDRLETQIEVDRLMAEDREAVEITDA